MHGRKFRGTRHQELIYLGSLQMDPQKFRGIRDNRRHCSRTFLVRLPIEVFSIELLVSQYHMGFGNMEKVIKSFYSLGSSKRAKVNTGGTFGCALGPWKIPEARLPSQGKECLRRPVEGALRPTQPQRPSCRSRQRKKYSVCKVTSTGHRP